MAAAVHGVERTVGSFSDLQEVVQDVGQEKGVHVKVGPVVEKLSDATAIANKLRKMERTKAWVATGLSQLKPFEDLAVKVQHANQAITKLLKLFDPNKGVTKKQKAGGRIKKQEKVMPKRRQATHLKDLGKDIKATQLKPMLKLGRSLVNVAKDVLAAKKPVAVINSNLTKLREDCRSIYNQPFEI